jgi:hypothetical protein
MTKVTFDLKDKKHVNHDEDHDWELVRANWPRSFHSQWQCNKCLLQITYINKPPPPKYNFIYRSCVSFREDLVEKVMES